MMKTTLQASRVLGAWLLAHVTTVGAAPAQDDIDPPPAQGAVRPAAVLELQVEIERPLGEQSRARQRLHDRFESYLNSLVDTIDRRHGLTPVQEKKLLLAGRADIQRFLDRLEEVDGKNRLLRDDAAERWRLVEELSTLAMMTGDDLFGERSLFAKVLASTLTKEQAADHHRLGREAVLRRHRATLDWVLDTWDHSLGLEARQHERLKGLLERETRPPRRFGSDDYFGVLCQVSRVPEAQLKAILSDQQWAKLRPEFAQAKQMEPMLRQRGYLPAPGVASVPDAAPPSPPEAEKKRG